MTWTARSTDTSYIKNSLQMMKYPPLKKLFFHCKKVGHMSNVIQKGCTRNLTRCDSQWDRQFREVRVTQKSELFFFFHFWVNTPPVLHPTEFFHCQYWNDPPNVWGSLEKSACSGRNISTIRRKIVWGARIPIIWVLIKPLNRKPRRLTRRSRATSPQSCAFFTVFAG